MKKKISESIQIKTFLSMLALLIVSCVLIYGLVMFFLPRNYHAELQSLSRLLMGLGNLYFQ